MQIIADMHVHTIASGHAYSTVNELALAGSEKGLAAIALTDHGPALPGGPHLYHFGAMRFLPKFIHGVRIVLGVEANIIDRSGNIDMPAEYLAKLEFVMAGLHENCGYESLGIVGNTDTVVQAMQNPRIKAISHPGNPAFPIDYPTVVKAAIETGTALEINNSSLTMSRQGSKPNCQLLAKLIASEGALAIIGSDAHIAQGVGEFHHAISLLTECGVGEKSVVNASLPQLMSFLDLPE